MAGITKSLSRRFKSPRRVDGGEEGCTRVCLFLCHIWLKRNQVQFEQQNFMATRVVQSAAKQTVEFFEV